MNAPQQLQGVLMLSVLLAAPTACVHVAPVNDGRLVVVAAGDVSHPDIGEQAVTARLVESLSPALVLVPGDAQYGEGTLAQFEHAYEPTWGRFKRLTRPSPGNHEYKSGAVGYFEYFGELAGPKGRGYYSFDLGDWHFVSLDTGHGCERGLCEPNSEQAKWLEADLAASTKRCTLAFWHHPRFNSGHHGAFLPSATFWTILRAHGVELVLNGHEHFYERFEPLDEAGQPTADGLVQFTVGTGGIGFSDFLAPVTGSVARRNDTYGVLRLSLGAADWEATFVPVPGSSGFTDSARGVCH